MSVDSFTKSVTAYFHFPVAKWLLEDYVVIVDLTVRKYVENLLTPYRKL